MDAQPSYNAFSFALNCLSACNEFNNPVTMSFYTYLDEATTSWVLTSTLKCVVLKDTIWGVRYSSVGSKEVSCFATYHFLTGSGPTVAKCFSE